MGFFVRIGVTVAAMTGVATVVAIVLAIYDIDRVGHGKVSFVNQPIGGPGLPMSWGDATLLACVFVGGVVAWIVSGRA